jgi:TP901-1 family phage major tail protein
MTTPLGRTFLLYYEDPATPMSYLKVANCKDNSEDEATEPIDVTDKDGAPDRTLIEGGIRSSEVSASGVFTDAASIKQMRIWNRDGKIKNFRMVDGLGNTVTGPYQIVSFSRAGSFDGEMTWDLKLSSAGARTYVDV